MSDPTQPLTDVQIIRSLEKLKRKREHLFALTNVIYVNSKKLKKESAQLFRAQLQHLDKVELEFAQVQDEIMGDDNDYLKS